MIEMIMQDIKVAKMLVRLQNAGAIVVIAGMWMMVSRRRNCMMIKIFGERRKDVI
jgi:hypothetical protein